MSLLFLAVEGGFFPQSLFKALKKSNREKTEFFVAFDTFWGSCDRDLTALRAGVAWLLGLHGLSKTNLPILCSLLCFLIFVNQSTSFSFCFCGDIWSKCGAVPSITKFGKFTVGEQRISVFLVSFEKVASIAWGSSESSSFLLEVGALSSSMSNNQR